MSYPYNTKAVIPFPVLPIVVYQVEGGAITKEKSAYIDTGADATLVPADLLENADLDEIYTAELRSHWGEPRTVSVYLVDLEVAGELLPAVDVIADDRSKDILLGRNVLNQFILLLDGTRQQTDILTRRPLRF